MHGPGLAYAILIFMGILSAFGSFAVLGVQSILKGKIERPWRLLAINFVSLFVLQFAILWLT